MTKKHFFFLLAGILIVAGGVFLLRAVRQIADDDDAPRTAHIGEQAYILEIADTDIERSKGLGGRASLCETCGMLFVFERPGRHAFWMKDMRFSLDIVWLLGNRVVFVAREVPADFAGTIDPVVATDRVLEFRAGTASAIEAGETIRFSH